MAAQAGAQPLPATYDDATGHEATPPPSQDHTVRDVAALLLVGATAAMTAVAVYRLLKLSGRVVTKDGVLAALVIAMSGTNHEPRMVGRTDVARAQRREESMYRAAYVINAAVRISRGILDGSTVRDAVRKERPFWSMHEKARKRRMAAAVQVAEAAEDFGLLLGWHARLDGHATPECLAADGSNFSALTPPAIGWPGTLHGGECRCTAGRPFRDAKTTDQATRHLFADSRRAS